MIFSDEFTRDLFTAGFSEKEVVEILQDEEWDNQKMYTRNIYVPLEKANDLPELRLPKGRSVCETCGGTGEIIVDVYDDDSHTHQPVGVTRCPDCTVSRNREDEED